MLTGDNSLLGNAQKTGPANNIGAAKDEVGLAYNTAMQGYYETKYASTNGTNGTFATKLEEAINEITSVLNAVAWSKDEKNLLKYNKTLANTVNPL